MHSWPWRSSVQRSPLKAGIRPGQSSRVLERFLGSLVHISYSSLTYSIHPGRLTWNLKMMVWKMIFLLNWVIFRFHVNLLGCNSQFRMDELFMAHVSLISKGNSSMKSAGQNSPLEPFWHFYRRRPRPSRAGWWGVTTPNMNPGETGRSDGNGGSNSTNPLCKNLAQKPFGNLKFAK